MRQEIPAKNPGLIVVVGPTASGKSSLAMVIAQSLPYTCAILSADSRQVYRELDIGTAKPSAEDQRRIAHYFVDICDPTETLTVADYQQQAQRVISQMHQDGKIIPMLVGGTGLYVDAIAKGLKIPKVSPQPQLRAQLTRLGQPYCYQLLKQVDVAATNRIHPNDQVRTLRALEVYYVTGKSISSQQGEDPPSYPILYMGLACEPDVLRSRITTRTHQMIETGLVGEVEALVEKYGAQLPLLKTLGYAEIVQYLSGECSLPQAIEQIIRHTCQFAKRQRTWFQKEPRIEWVSAGSSDLVDTVIERVTEFLAI